MLRLDGLNHGNNKDEEHKREKKDVNKSEKVNEKKQGGVSIACECA